MQIQIYIQIRRAGNLADGWSKAKGGPSSWQYEEWEDHRVVHAPVGEFLPNGFGLHDTIGNLWEWCRDGRGDYDDEVTPGNGLRAVTGPRYRVFRGGSFANPASNVRSADCRGDTPEYRSGDLGVRPAVVIKD